MSDFEIKFECHGGKYEIQHFTAEEIARSKSPYGPPITWQLVRIGALTKTVRPTAKQMKSAVDLLVKCDRAQLPKVALGIARAMGPLVPGGRYEPSFSWESMADKLRGMFEGKEEEFHPTMGAPLPPSDSAHHAGMVGVYLIPDKEGGRKLAIRPNNLFEALPLYAAHMIATGTTFHTCEHCKAPFLGGGAGRGRNRKRADARFCSDACRWGYHNASRRKIRSKSKS